MKKVVIGNDHGGVKIAEKLGKHLQELGYSVNWLGTRTEDPVDYPDIVKVTTDEYKKGGYEFGILCCGTGIGVTINANKTQGIWCALPQNCFAAKATKEHNHPDFIAFGGRIDYPEDPIAILDAFIDAENLQEPRHLRRLEKLKELDGHF